MPDVIVVGGGPAGAGTALRLARQGFSVSLLERHRLPRHKACAEYMSPGVVRQLHRLGVGEAVERAAGARLDGFTLFAGDRSFTGRFAGAPVHAAPQFGLGIARSTMDAILVRAAADAGVDVQENARVIDLLWKGDGVAGVQLLQAGRRHDMAAALVIGADGIRSVVAHRLQAFEPRKGMERIALVAHLGGIEGLTSRGEMHVGRGGYCGVAPLGNGVANVAMVLKDAAPRIRGRTDAFFWDFLRTLPNLSGRLDRAETVRPVMAIGPLAKRTRVLCENGVLLVGDAGGYFDPFTGQGVHRALVTGAMAAHVAGDALRRGDVSRQSLLPYEQRRRKTLRSSHAVEWLVQQFLGRPVLFNRAVRRLATDQAMADTLIGVTGDIVPPGRVLNPWFLARLGI
ncbi:MAG: NAD(P)/FAD-dependent oxidoreductase [Dehalococcoidia bacterium]